MSRFPLALTVEQRKILKDIKYLNDKTYTDTILEILDEYLPVKLEKEQKLKEEQEKKKQQNKK